MSNIIPRKFIEDLLARIDIVETINSRVQLKKAGANYNGLCPFHTEKTPSFTVSPTKQFYYCFGCGAHGDAIAFLMNFDRAEFVDAVETLASQIGLSVPHDQTSTESSNKQFYELLSKINSYYQNQLRNCNNAIEYLKNRGLTGEICKRYGVGYAKEGWDHLVKTVATDKTTQNQLQATGMLIKNDNSGYYDRFRNRIMFPIRDPRGRVIGFGGRAISATDTAKYLNSPETAIFHKGSELYGLFEAKQYNNQLSYLIVVEGYMDVIALAQHEIGNVVATLGTATTSKHIQKLFRYTPKIIFCFDGDQAGRKAAWRALEQALPLMHDGKQTLFLFLPIKEDPDSFVRKVGKQQFLTTIKEAVPLSEFFFQQLSDNISLQTVAGRAQLAQTASNLLNKMPQGVFQNLMFDKLAQIVHMDPNKLKNLHKIPQNRVASTVTEPHGLIRSALKLLLHDPALASYIDDPTQIAKLNIDYSQLLSELLLFLKTDLNTTIGNILAQWKNSEESAIIASLAAHEIVIPEKNLQTEFIATIEKLYAEGREQTIQILLDKAHNKQLTDKERYKLQKLIKDAKIRIAE